MRTVLQKWLNKNVRFTGIVAEVDKECGAYLMLKDVKIIPYAASMEDEEKIIYLDHIWLFEKQVKALEKRKVGYRSQKCSSLIANSSIGKKWTGVATVQKYIRKNRSEDIGIRICCAHILKEVLSMSKKWSFERKRAYLIDLLEKLNRHALNFDLNLSFSDAKNIIMKEIEEVQFQINEREKRTANQTKGTITCDPLIPKTRKTKVKGFSCK